MASKTGLLSVNTLLPPSSSSAAASPISPILAKKKYVLSHKPFAAESEEDIKFGINDSAEDHKFQSYHLDYKYTPPVIKGPCIVCSEYIVGPMVTAIDAMWHPECFECINCRIMLIPPNYQEHDGKPYCKRCHNSLFLPPCARCGKDLPEKFVKALGKYWCPECFQCSRCRVKLDPKKFYEKDNKPYCEFDYNDLFKPKCNACKQPIIQTPMQAMGKEWHPNCFVCSNPPCKKQLQPNDFKQMNGLPYCNKCHAGLFLPKCGSCVKPIKEAPVNAMGKTFHPACFTCANPPCKRRLSPDDYMEKNGQPFCKKCHADLFMPKCGGCSLPVTAEKPLRAMGKPYHPACFVCSNPPCKRRLSPDDFIEKNGKPYCNKCHADLFLPKCGSCQAPILQTPLKAMGKQFHPKCFTCTNPPCGKQLRSDNFTEKNGAPYCTDCYHNLFTPKCYGCKQPILGEVLKAMGQTWHPDHFSCCRCSRNLPPDNFKERDGRIYCPDCHADLFLPKCKGCRNPVAGKALLAMDAHWHPEHFRCTQCNRQLAEDAFYEQNERPYCTECFMRMFAPKCKGCKRPITNEVYLFVLDGDWHENCFRCRECNCLLDENTFYEFDGEPYCEEHYHAKICPDCIKMRRAVDKYLGNPEGTLSKPDSVLAYKSLNLPNSRPGSRMSLHGPDGDGRETPIPIIRQDEQELDRQIIPFNNSSASRGYTNENRSVSSRSEAYNGHNHGAETVCCNSGDAVHTHVRIPEPVTTRTVEEHMVKHSDKLVRAPQDFGNWNYPEQEPSNMKTSSIIEYNPSSGGPQPDYFRRDTAFNKSSGKFPVGNMQFETTFNREVCESVSRY